MKPLLATLGRAFLIALPAALAAAYLGWTRGTQNAFFTASAGGDAAAFNGGFGFFLVCVAVLVADRVPGLGAYAVYGAVLGVLGGLLVGIHVGPIQVQAGFLAALDATAVLVPVTLFAGFLWDRFIGG